MAVLVPAAYASYRLIELPGQRLGNIIRDRLARMPRKHAAAALGAADALN